jgi:hypothetical protein
MSTLVRGRVTQAGRPLRRFQVQIQKFRRTRTGRWGLSPLMTCTGDDGRFTLRRVPSGECVVSGWKKERGTDVYVTLLTRIPKTPRHLLDLELPAGGRLSGTVVDRASGAPIWNARVDAIPRCVVERRPGIHVSVASSTDRKRHYNLHNAMVGLCDVVSRRLTHSVGGPYIPSTINIVEGTTIRFDIVLEPESGSESYSDGGPYGGLKGKENL